MQLDAAAIAAEILDARRDMRRLEPLTSRFPGFDVASAYQVAEQLRRLRKRAGERPVGRKIGFTNRNIWPEYGVFGPIWGEVYDTTLIDVAPGARIDIGHLSQPRIEPEIVLGVDRDVHAGMTIEELESAIGWVAYGFEVVQTVFADWKFAAADCIADGGLHGLLLLGEKRELEKTQRVGLAQALSSLQIVLSRDGAMVDQGVGTNVLDGPVQALRFLADGTASEPSSLPVTTGEVVTTGTITRAFPIAAGERRSTTVSGFDLPGLDVTFQ